jgi:hypothetical protein
MHVHTLQFTDEELTVLQSAINAWVNTFTHDEADLLRQGKDLRERIDAELRHRSPTAAGNATATSGATGLRPR